jgi:hypothetical protein
LDTRERKKQHALHRLGTQSPYCVVCGEADWRCLELHHLAGRAYDDTTAILCRNCHRKLSDAGANAAAPTNPPRLECIGRLLEGLGLLFTVLASSCKQLAAELRQAAVACPRPWGWDAPLAPEAAR